MRPGLASGSRQSSAGSFRSWLRGRRGASSLGRLVAIFQRIAHPGEPFCRRGGMNRPAPAVDAPYRMPLKTPRRQPPGRDIPSVVSTVGSPPVTASGVAALHAAPVRTSPVASTLRHVNLMCHPKFEPVRVLAKCGEFPASESSSDPPTTFLDVQSTLTVIAIGSSQFPFPRARRCCQSNAN